MYPYGQGGQRINSIAAQYVPYQNLVSRSPVYLSNQPRQQQQQQQQYNPRINNYFNPYSRLIN
jgi:hypothetical protein